VASRTSGSVDELDAEQANDFERALEDARARHVDAGILLSSPLVFLSSKPIGELAMPKWLPLIGLFGEFPKPGVSQLMDQT
jgi:putative tryptophan/tyrosine transport system substrate-binding protein